jgi:hypothetical protein
MPTPETSTLNCAQAVVEKHNKAKLKKPICRLE